VEEASEVTDYTDSRGISRRELLARTALIGAGLAAAPLLLAACANTLEETGNRSGNDMQTRKLGALEVSEVGAGCMSISANYGPPADRNQGIRTIRTAHEKGVTLVKSSDVVYDVVL
jgi:predicted small secreted protein